MPASLEGSPYLRKRYVLLAAALAVGVVGWWGYKTGNISPERILAVIDRYPVWAPVLFMLASALCSICLLPLGLSFNFAAGILWGSFAGGVFATLGSLTAATFAFLFARYLGRDLLFKYLQRKNKLWLLEPIRQHDWQLIFIASINPVMPFGLMNYLFGLSTVSFWRFILVTAAANLPMSIAFAALGQTLSQLVLTKDLQQVIIHAGIALAFFTVAYGLHIFWRRKPKP